MHPCLADDLAFTRRILRTDSRRGVHRVISVKGNHGVCIAPVERCQPFFSDLLWSHLVLRLVSIVA